MDHEQSKKILIVDDEESILKVVSQYFTRKGYQTVTAKNGNEAIQVLEKEPVDCCFTDINMPGMNGLDFAEYVRKADNTLPVIVMTGYPSLENTIRTIKNGVVDFLVKPVNLKQMELCVQRVLRQRRLFVENILLQKEVEGKERIEKLNQELMQKVAELHVLNKILSNFTTFSSTSDVFRRAVGMAVEIAKADASKFYVINESVQQPFEVASAESDKNQSKPHAPADIGAPMPVDSGNGGRATLSPAIAGLVMEVASDEIPLLISRNNGFRGLPPDMKSLMLVPLKIRNKVFGVLTAAVRQSQNHFTEKDLYYLSFLAQSAVQAIENLALYENIYENLFATLYGFVNALEARDLYTRQHSSRVTGIALILGRELGCTTEEIDILNFSGHLHDIGKIGIRDDILLKPGKLTVEEFEKIKEHPVIGANILEQFGMWEQERCIIRCHHERFDGTGYPDGLKQEAIPFLARILSVADVYDAMASDRAYRQRMEEAVVLKIIGEGAGSQFDPQVVAAFQKVYAEGKISHFLETGQLN
ncbi:MAG: response regulator [Desulfobacterales bacterium]|nr:MAG: response regulator [Desulfobacterales bacterium]